MTDVLRWAGLTNPSGPWYAFWSGIGSDLAYLSIFSLAWRHVNCHEPLCHRVGRHHITVNGVGHRACARHITAVHTRAHTIPLEEAS